MPYPLKKLRRILVSYGAWEEPNRGRGSHTMFKRNIGGGVFSYTFPTKRAEVNDCYVKGVRKKFKLTEADGVSDSDFFSRA